MSKRWMIWSFTATLLLAVSAQAQEIADRAAGERCGPYTVRGVYSMAYRGTRVALVDGVPTQVPLVLLGMVSVDPATGAITGGATINAGGEAFDIEFVDSVVDVRPDCTASATYFVQRDVFPAPARVTERWVVQDGGDRIKVIVTGFEMAPQASLGTLERLTLAQRPVRW